VIKMISIAQESLQSIMVQT